MVLALIGMVAPSGESPRLWCWRARRVEGQAVVARPGTSEGQRPEAHLTRPADPQREAVRQAEVAQPRREVRLVKPAARGFPVA